MSEKKAMDSTDEHRLSVLELHALARDCFAFANLLGELETFDSYIAKSAMSFAALDGSNPMLAIFKLWEDSLRTLLFPWLDRNGYPR